MASADVTATEKVRLPSEFAQRAAFNAARSAEQAARDEYRAGLAAEGDRLLALRRNPLLSDNARARTEASLEQIRAAFRAS